MEQIDVRCNNPDCKRLNQKMMKNEDNYICYHCGVSVSVRMVN